MDAAKILVVDDDADVRRMLSEYLGDHGYRVSAVGDGAAMRAQLERELPDLVLLDLSLPGDDGLTLARQLRARHNVGIIMVTGSSEPIDRVVGLEVGADDYIGKPFDPRELRARIKSVLRRTQSQTAPALPAAGDKRVAVGNLRLDLAAHALFDRDGAEVALTTMEFELLKAFVERPNQVLSRDQLLSLSRDRSWEPFDRSIDIRITRLRRKIEDDPDKPRLIRTVRGAGYMYVPAASPGPAV
jgi:two-component system phosphate regulon response regulator OmpR